MSSFDWQGWIQKFIDNPGYNDTEAVISEAINPAYEVIGVHCLTPSEDHIKQCVYVDILSKNNLRQVDAKIECNVGNTDSISISIQEHFDEVAWLFFPCGSGAINVWHNDGEGVFGLKSEYSYLIVFREIDKPEPKPNFGGIQVTVNQEWVANMRPDRQGNVTFFVDIK